MVSQLHCGLPLQETASFEASLRNWGFSFNPHLRSNSIVFVLHLMTCSHIRDEIFTMLDPKPYRHLSIKKFFVAYYTLLKALAVTFETLHY